MVSAHSRVCLPFGRGDKRVRLLVNKLLKPNETKQTFKKNQKQEDIEIYFRYHADCIDITIN